MSDIENVAAAPAITDAPVYDVVDAAAPVSSGLEQTAVAPVETTTQSTPIGLEALSETYRNDPSLKDFKTLDDLAKSYVNAKSMIGQSIRIPGPDASEEAKAEFYRKLEAVPGVVKFDPNSDDIYKRLGKPESPDNYQVQFDPQLNSDITLQKNFLAKAHAAGLNSKQAQELIDYQNGYIREAAEQIKEQVLGFQEAVKAEFGPDFQNRMVAANTGVTLMAKKYPELGGLLKANPVFANHPAIVNLFSNLGKQAIEGNAGIGAAVDVKFGMSSAEAQSKIAEVRANPNHPSKNPRDPDHKEALARVQELYRIASHAEM